MEVPQTILPNLVSQDPDTLKHQMGDLHRLNQTIQDTQTSLDAMVADYQDRLDKNPLTLPLALGYAQMHKVSVDPTRPVIFTREGKLVLNVVTAPAVVEKREGLPACVEGLELDNNGFPLIGDLYDLLRKNGVDPVPFGRNKKQMLAELSRLEETNGIAG